LFCIRFLQRIFWIIEKAPFIPNKKYICLGITCSLEHLTACLAEILLTTKEGRHLLERMAPSHRILWVWHAIEETEHKAVAYDVYAAAGGWYISRVFRHVIATVVFVLVMTYINCLFLVDRGTVTFSTLVGVAKLLYFLLGYPGFFRKFAPLWCEYLSPNYHPWGHGEAGKLHREVMNQAIVDWTEEMNLMTLQLGRASEGPIQESKSAKHIDNRKSVKSD
jgi:predicted metal-dependent hydrolase